VIGTPKSRAAGVPVADVAWVTSSPNFDRAAGHIVWQCPICGDYGLIHGWEDTLWNRQGGTRPESSDMPPMATH
jgi:hypothetical protein